MSVPDATGYSEPQEAPVLIIAVAQWRTDRQSVMTYLLEKIEGFLQDRYTGVFGVELLDHDHSHQRAGVCVE